MKTWMHRRVMTRRAPLIDRHFRKLYVAWLCTILVSGVLVAYGPLAGLTWAKAFMPLLAGGGMGLALMELVRLRRQVTEERLLGRLPRQVDILSEDDEQQVIAVTRRNGEAVVVNLPPDYHPGQDGGELVMRHVVPELFTKEEDGKPV